MTYINTEELRRAATSAQDAAENMRRQADRLEEVKQSLVHMFEHGYGGNALRLIELLENVDTNPVQSVTPLVFPKYMRAGSVTVIKERIISFSDIELAYPSGCEIKCDDGVVIRVGVWSHAVKELIEGK